MADPGAVERVAVPPGIGAYEVERSGGEDVLQMSLLETEAAGTSHPDDRDGLVDDSLDARAGCVLGSPLLIVLLEAGMVEGFLHLAGLQAKAAGEQRPPARQTAAGLPLRHRRALRPQTGLLVDRLRPLQSAGGTGPPPF